MAKDRRAMVNPFAGIKKEAPTEEAPKTSGRQSSTAVAPVAEKARRVSEAREFVGFRLSPALVERARAAAWTQRLTLTAYVEAAIESAVVAAERENGGPFPPVPRRSRAV